ncbi:MAG: integrase arm-type DNA-binding domain-containing protein [Rhodanobacteraceae bacterium]|nr:integrase arm-type DNA-binding domain-containing protein [Rhodanobacteraceae bacterium]
MTARAKPLVTVAINAAKPRDKPYKLADGQGLYLEVMPNGARYWRMKYRFAGKERRIAFGVFPEVSLSEARRRREEARAALRDGADPVSSRREERRAREVAAVSSFEAVAREWMAKQTATKAPATCAKNAWLLETFAFPAIGRRPVSEITAPEVLEIVRKVEARGTHETAHRLLQRLGAVFGYAVATGRASRNPARDLDAQALHPVKTKHRAAVTDPQAVGGLLRAVWGYSGQPVTLAAMQLSALLFVRPEELRGAQWSEFDLDAATWTIPPQRRKLERKVRDNPNTPPHLVPLSAQAVAILRALQPLTGRGRLVFPSLRTPDRPISENTINSALRRLGYSQDEMTAHGFRALASTRLNELGFPPDVIERQLAHVERDKVRAAYNRAAYLEERRRMMQAWSDYLDALREGAPVVAIRARA